MPEIYEGELKRLLQQDAINILPPSSRDRLMELLTEQGNQLAKPVPQAMAPPEARAPAGIGNIDPLQDILSSNIPRQSPQPFQPDRPNLKQEPPGPDWRQQFGFQGVMSEGVDNLNAIGDTVSSAWEGTKDFLSDPVNVVKGVAKVQRGSLPFAKEVGKGMTDYALNFVPDLIRAPGEIIQLYNEYLAKEGYQIAPEGVEWWNDMLEEKLAFASDEVSVLLGELHLATAEHVRGVVLVAPKVGFGIRHLQELLPSHH